MATLTSTQINQLASTLTWLTGLIVLSVLLLVSSLAWFDGWGQSSHPVQLQCRSNSTQRIKSTTFLTPARRRGKSLFVTNCQSCHEIATAKLVGPGLLGVAVRVPDQQWLMRWIKNPSAVLESGDVYANQLIKDFAPTLMPGFPTLKKAEIKAIIDYVGSYKIDEIAFLQ